MRAQTFAITMSQAFTIGFDSDNDVVHKNFKQKQNFHTLNISKTQSSKQNLNMFLMYLCRLTEEEDVDDFQT